MSFSFRKGLLPALTTVASLVFTIALLELGLRISHTVRHWGEGRGGSKPLHRASAIPGLDYEMAPNLDMLLVGIPVKTNQYGMRDSESFAQKTQSPCRIAVLGDSYTFGWGTWAEQSYPKVLEKLLRESAAAAACTFEVLNFAVMGYSSYDEALMLRYRAVNFDPHVVIIGYVLNDPEVDPVQPLHAYFVKPPWWKPYRLLGLISQVETTWDQKRLGEDYYVYLHHQGRRKWQSVVDAFSDIRHVTSRRNIKVLVVIFPELGQSFKGKPWTDYPYTKIHKQVSDLAVRNGFRVVDLLAAYSAYPSQDVVFPVLGDDHPSVLGHEVAAGAIEKELLAESSYFFDLKPQQPDTSSR